MTVVSSHANMLFAGRYSVLGKVGVGGMAEVYKAQDMNLGRFVAIKVMLPQYAANSQFVMRFRNEARSAAALNSPHIVSVYDSGQSGNQCYIVMEYVEGINLRESLRKHGTFQPARAASIASQVCLALAEAHGHNVVHSDIKSSNIMMMRSGDAKVIDFGIAQARRSIIPDNSPVIGTVQYMSPEQLAGGTLTPASDIYSLGVTLYEMCTGKLPFDAASLLQNPRQAAGRSAMPPTKLNPAIPAALEQIIMRCMQDNPQQRYLSAIKMKRELDNYLSTVDKSELEAVSTGVGPEFWALVFAHEGQQRGNAVRVTGAATIGRSPQADIQIPVNSISKMHARVTPQGTFLLVEDLGSSNGTLLNGMPIHERALCRQGDILTIGDTRLIVACSK